MTEMKNICGKIPKDLHEKVREEIELTESSTQKFIRRTHIFLNMDNGVFHQQSKNYSHHYIILERRPKRKIHRNDKGDSMSKYKITEIEHPKYPWLHRIQALIDIFRRKWTTQ